MNHSSKYDILIVGAGLAGASLAVALSGSRYRIALVEGRSPAGDTAPWDARIYAVSPANVRFLEQIGAWKHLDGSRMAPVYDMEVCGDRGGKLNFSAFDSGVEELAWILEGRLMQRELWETVKRQANLDLFCPARPEALQFLEDGARLELEDGRGIEASLVVAADGADSWVRNASGIQARWTPYHEKGVVANFACELPHRNTACQWFLDSGVLAWLPLPGNLMSMVWSTPFEHADELVALPAQALCERVAAAGDHRLGKLELVTPAAGFALRLMRPGRTVAPRLALIGDAAHAIHPLSGHGINLGFQDARVLAEVLRDLPAHRDCGDERELRRYQRARAEETFLLQAATHSLRRLFQPTDRVLGSLRNAGMSLTNHLHPLKDLMVRYALG
ncbi:MAG: UbiH/UbiF family hydroxylase [Rhodocyclaceae bacterium]|nr:UbiH/UbiF family hydroxylase [Rhodocyclaceae bacterium]